MPDPFAVLAEPGRRRLLEVLGPGERPVNDVVRVLGWPQPQVSKHLGVLRDAGLVSVRRDGRKRLYSVNGENLRPVHDWAAQFERFWGRQLDRIKQRAERRSRAGGPTQPGHSTKEKQA